MISQDKERNASTESGQAHSRPFLSVLCIVQQSHLRWFHSVVHNNNTSFARAFFTFEESLSTVFGRLGLRLTRLTRRQHAHSVYFLHHY